MTTATEGTTSIEELLNDPTKLPTDPNELADVLAKAGQGDSASEPAKTDEPKTGEGAGDAGTKTGEGEAGDKGKGAQSGESPDAGKEKQGDVLAKDGKHTIPYAVLESTRQRAADAERDKEDALRQAEEATRRAKELEDELKKRGAGGDDAQAGDGKGDGKDDVVAKLKASNEAMEKLAAETPALAEMFKPLIDANIASIQRLDDLQGRVNQFEKRQQDEDRQEQVSAADRVQQAIDRNPVLRYLQNEDGEMFNRAVVFDKQIRDDPKFKGLSLDERFEKVVKAVEATYGTIELPEKYKPAAAPGKDSKTEGAVKDGKSDKSQDGDIQARAKANLEKAKAGEKPLTLSDLPGGASPATTDKRLEDMGLDEIDGRINAMLDKGMSIQDIVANYS